MDEGGEGDRDSNHDFCLPDVAERVRVTSSVAEADQPSTRQPRASNSSTVLNASRS